MIRAVLGPLVRGSTYRRGVHQLLGTVILLPYVLLGVAFAQLFTGGDVPMVAVLLLMAVAGLIAVTPAFLDGTRAVEIVAARNLLEVDLPDPIARADRETRLRSALWFALHLGFGGLTGFGLFAALPVAFVFLARQLGAGAELGPLADLDPTLVSLIGLAMLVALVYLVAGLGALAAQVAPALLGPTPAEEIAALQQRAERLAERNRLARELHDSVGHALTVTTIQAAAAQRLVDTDPAFVRKALAAIEETGRSAMEDLDHVLGLMREDGPPRAAPIRTLADVDRIVADARTSGLTIDVALDGPLATVPPAVSREGYRIVQEGLTNVVRHAGRVRATLRIALTDGVLRIDLANERVASPAGGEPATGGPGPGSGPAATDGSGPGSGSVPAAAGGSGSGPAAAGGPRSGSAVAGGSGPGSGSGPAAAGGSGPAAAGGSGSGPAAADGSGSVPAATDGSGSGPAAAGGSGSRSAAADGPGPGPAAAGWSTSGAGPAVARKSGAAGGRGLAGMRERVDLLGGTMTAGPDGGQWRVTVNLPISGERA